VALMASLLVLATACGDDDDADRTGDDASAVCDAKDELDSSVNALGDLNVSAEGTNAVDAAVDDVRNDIEAVRDATQGEVDDEVDDVETAFDELEAAVAMFGDQESTGAAVAGLGNAVADLATAVGALFEALPQDCDGGA
jgi:hypothetical protein